MPAYPLSGLFRGLRPPRVVAAALLALVFLAAPVAAQLDTPGHLLSAVQPSRVTQVNATQGMLDNSRIWRGDAAADVVSTLRGYDATFTATTRIQAFTWDWYRNAPRTDVTPMVFLVIALEEWQTYCGEVPAEVGEGDVWLRRWLSQCAPEYQRTNTLACYDVGDPAVYDCHQYQGGMERQFEASHINYLTVTRAVGDEIAAALMSKESNGMDDFKLYLQGVDALEAIISFGIPALVFIVFAVLGIVGATELAARIRAVAKGVRKYVDEPTDQLILAVEGVGEFVLKKDLDPKVLSRILTAVADAMGEGVPLGEKVDAA